MQSEPGSSSPGSDLQGITGTPAWAPYSLLLGQPHTMSTQLEGLFISLVHIACDGRGCGQDMLASMDLQSWAGLRCRQFATPEMMGEKRMAQALLPLVRRLHGLFWKLPDGGLLRHYQQDVTCEQVLQACLEVCSDINQQPCTWPARARGPAAARAGRVKGRR